MAHGLGAVLKAAKLLEAEKSIHFLLVGDGAEREKLLREKEALGLDNVTMLGQQPKGPYLGHHARSYLLPGNSSQKNWTRIEEEPRPDG